MKLVVLILAFSFSSVVFAENWFPVGKVGSKTIYTKESRCESVEAVSCYDITGKDIRRFKVGFLMPTVTHTIDCASGPDCQALIDLGGQCATATYDDKANWPSLDFASENRSVTGWFIWCQIEGLIPDPSGIAAADLEDSQKASDASARDTARGVRETVLDQCVQNSVSGTMTNLQMSECIRALVRELRGDQVPIGDL